MNKNGSTHVRERAKTILCHEIQTHNKENKRKKKKKRNPTNQDRNPNHLPEQNSPNNQNPDSKEKQ